MNDFFAKTMRERYRASSDIIESMWEFSTLTSFPAKEIICSPDEVVNHSYFILDGAIQQYVFNELNKKHVTRFFIHGDFFSSVYLKLFSEQKAQVYSKSITEIKAIQFEKKDLIKVSETNPNYLAFLARYFMNMYREGEARAVRKLELNASERYAHFIHQYPDLTEKVPVKYIAEYLGIHPGSLSRIKAQMKN